MQNVNGDKIFQPAPLGQARLRKKLDQVLIEEKKEAFLLKSSTLAVCFLLVGALFVPSWGNQQDLQQAGHFLETEPPPASPTEGAYSIESSQTGVRMYWIIR